MPLVELCEPGRGYLVNDTVVIEAGVTVHMIVDIWANDLIKDTGFVGLENQGATCSLNSLLQTLYHVPYFRKAVYQIPTEDDIPSQSVALALQILFFKLQHSDTSVATEDLTKSFGWSTDDSLTQHDVHELNIMFSVNLENKMQGTIVEGTMRELFEGHFLEYVKCTDVDFASEKRECFKDLQLDVKDCKDVYASFDKYTKAELLKGFNRYRADHYGLQEAKKRVLFIDFPPVLLLQLKRFEFHYVSNRMVKINDRFEFLLKLDLDRDNGKYLSPEADRRVRNIYTLHSVLVHSGDIHGGHYYAFVRAGLANKWYKFNDDQVTEENMERKLEELYGDANDGCSSAYMLVYIREGDKDKIICDVDDNDIPEHLRVSLRKEKEDKRRNEAQAYLFTIIKVARDEDLREQIGRNIFFDLVDHDKIRSFRIQRQMPFKHFKEVVANEFGLPVKFLRFWVWIEKENGTYRPHRPLTYMEESQKVGHLRDTLSKISHAPLDLFLEVEYGPDLVPIPPPKITKEDILLFFKFYDPQKEELRYVGRLFVNKASTPNTIQAELNRLAGFVPEQDNHFFEERFFEPYYRIDVFYKMVSFKSRQMQNGDIICFQAYRITDCERPFRFAFLSSFLEMVEKRQVVHFRARQKPKEDGFCLELSKFNTHDEVVERLAEKLSLDDPSRIMLTSHNFYTERPKPYYVEYGSAECLLHMLLHEDQELVEQSFDAFHIKSGVQATASFDAFHIKSGYSDILYYDVLDIPVPRPHGLKTLNVEFHYAMNDEVVILNVRLPTVSTVEDVTDDIKKKVELSRPDAEIRLFEVFDHRIYKVYSLYELIEKINDRYWTLRAEEIPEGEDDLFPYEHLFRVHHYTKQTSHCHLNLKNFGEPFFLVVKDGETLAQVKGRIQKKLQVENEEFSKWNFAVLFLGHPKYLEDTDVLASFFERQETSPFESSLRREISGGRQPYICLEHSDGQPGSSNQ